jgi:TolA-binding protein
MAESYYGQGDYSAALRKYDDLRNSTGAYATELYEQSGYGMGYTYFKMKQYGEAATAFRRFVGAEKRATMQRSDAMVRLGDCYFVTKDNAQAVKWYDDAVKAGAEDRDYALFQKGVCQGLERQFPEKIATLKNLLSAQPNSRYAADAKFQLGETYVATDKDNDALGYYDQVIKQHANSPHVRQSMLQAAEIHKRKGDTNKAIEQLKAIIAKYPTVDESRDALAALENIYVEQGRVAEYETYVRSLSFVDPSTLDLDEKYYRSAEQLYFDNKCAQAVGAFGDYLNKYPHGAFAVNAQFYRGDCLYRDAKYSQALPDLEATIKADASQFLESALFGASDILYRDKRWEGALDHFEQLEPIASFPQNRLAAQVGQMRTLKELGRMADAAKAAAKVSANSDATADLKAEADLVVAKGLLDSNDLDGAFTKFKAITTKSTNALGAEAKYNMAYVRYLQQKYTDTEKEVFDLLKKYPAYDHWKAKSFILLADAYVKLDDRFQAKAALQGVIDNSEDPELVAQARQRLNTINASEVRQTTPTPQEDLLVPMPGTDNTNEE